MRQEAQDNLEFLKNVNTSLFKNINISSSGKQQDIGEINE
jgi:hypothetical protein